MIWYQALSYLSVLYSRSISYDGAVTMPAQDVITS